MTFVPSHRPKHNRTLKPSLARDRTWCMMHNLKPAVVTVDENGEATVHNVSTPNWKQKYIPAFPQALHQELNKLWGCLIYGVSHASFRRKQYGKHGRHYKLSGGGYWKNGISKIGRVYVKKGSLKELIKKMKSENYRPGFEYNCMAFADDLRKSLGHPVAVLFKDLPEGGGKYLHEISILFHTNFDLYMAARREKFKETDFFHMEDFSRRKKKLFNLFSVKMGMNSKYLSKNCHL